MTTAHRPTWNSATGGNADKGNWSLGGATSQQFSARDLPGHNTLKTRQAGQTSKDDVLGKDLKEELRLRESEAADQKLREKTRVVSDKTTSSSSTLLLKAAGEVGKASKKKGKSAKAASGVPDDTDDFVEDDSDDESSDDDDDDDDEEELMRELAKIKREREEERKKQESLAAEELLEQQKEDALTGNPLLNDGKGAGGKVMKRRWNDDVVFKNQARSEPETKRRFINDTIRNDFHRRFLKKHMQ